MEDNASAETVTEEDSQEERERKEMIPQRKGDIARCWSKYCLDMLKTSKDTCVQDMRRNDPSGEEDEEQRAEQGVDWAICSG